MQITELSSDARSALLLDYVKARVSEEQRIAIEKAMVLDPALAEEVAYYQGLNAALSDRSATTSADELGWARLSRAIAKEAAPQAANDNARLWRYATAALGLAVAIQAALLAGGGRQFEDPNYTIASSQAEEHGIHIMFSPAATIVEVTEVLRSLDGQVFDGPSALGLYSVQFESEDARNAAIITLETRSDIIQSVSPK